MRNIWILTCENPIFHTKILRSIQLLVPEDQIIDVFENTIYSSEYRLFSKLKLDQNRMISVPCREFIELVEKKKREEDMKGLPVVKIYVEYKRLYGRMSSL